MRRATVGRQFARGFPGRRNRLPDWLCFGVFQLLYVVELYFQRFTRTLCVRGGLRCPNLKPCQTRGNQYGSPDLVSAVLCARGWLVFAILYPRERATNLFVAHVALGYSKCGKLFCKTSNTTRLRARVHTTLALIACGNASGGVCGCSQIVAVCPGFVPDAPLHHSL